MEASTKFLKSLKKMLDKSNEVWDNHFTVIEREIFQSIRKRAWQVSSSE